MSVYRVRDPAHQNDVADSMARAERATMTLDLRPGQVERVAAGVRCLCAAGE